MNDRLPMHNALKPLAWLEGTWRTEATAQGQFPTIKPFGYCDEIKFVSIGQPMLNFEAQSWHPEKKNPMHREVGFLKIIPESNRVALIASHNFGLATIEEGVVGENEIKLESVSVSRMSQGTKEPFVTKVNCYSVSLKFPIKVANLILICNNVFFSTIMHSPFTKENEVLKFSIVLQLFSR